MTARAIYQMMFRLLLAEFTRADRQPESPMGKALRSYVQARLGAPITVTALAAQAGLSRYHFIRLYRQQTGRTPMAEVRRMRLETARDWLLTTTVPLKEIAQRCGLGNSQSFSHAFAAQHGQPPATFRRAHQGD